MSKLIDHTGQKFGRLTVIKRNEESTINGKHATWLCICECGKECHPRGADLRRGKQVSCGCLKNEKASARSWKHGMSHSKLNSVWKSMKQRCGNPNNKDYPGWGEKGITVCHEWANDFKCFYDWSIKSGYSDGSSIDRIDNEKGYSPENCRWATQTEQANNRSDNRTFLYKGKMSTLSELARMSSNKYSTIQTRINLGWSVQSAVETPAVKGRNQYTPEETV